MNDGDATFSLKLYFAYSSPYSYLAMEPAWELEGSHRVRVRFIPYGVKIRKVYGGVEERATRQWNKVRYSYLDVRRFARERGLTIFGPERLYHTKLAMIGGLYAQQHGAFRPYSERVFERFFKRQLDIESLATLGALIEEVGLDREEFERYTAREGPNALKRGVAEAEADKIFGIPTFVVDRELFWGHDRIDWVIRRLDALGLRRK